VARETILRLYGRRAHPPGKGKLNLKNFRKNSDILKGRRINRINPLPPWIQGIKRAIPVNYPISGDILK